MGALLSQQAAAQNDMEIDEEEDEEEEEKVQEETQLMNLENVENLKQDEEEEEDEIFEEPQIDYSQWTIGSRADVLNRSPKVQNKGIISKMNLNIFSPDTEFEEKNVKKKKNNKQKKK